MSYEQILTEQRGAVTLLTLNRPEKLNAWTPRMSAELTDAIRAANDDPAVGAVVVTGAGRAFCAGADIGGEFKSQLDKADEGASRPEQDEAAPSPWVELCRGSKPLVAAINGHSMGVGLTMILPFDYLVASEEAKLSCRFVKMGITPELASSYFLVQRCGFGAASDLALSGRIVEGAEAHRLGLVDAVVAPERVVDTAVAKANEYAENSPAALHMIKDLLTHNAAEVDLDAVQRREMEALQAAFKTPEHREAVNAFLEKRAPKFR